ncbi:hypothetical protein PIROE2DRAFT_8611 [Piromyces sp. E2]|nr:hypothetical protein PIROE2DRAFT_8611 [Piromyces sp. E2]|eukprot:OUM64540.1 hypothetical protein PIROE2DRAFT_8611 [Piromyces sp. E2]
MYIYRQDLACKSDTNCPEYSKCQNYEENGQTFSICRFEYFLCRELDNEPCMYINSTIWNTKFQIYQNKYLLEKLTPIIKTCPSRINGKKNKCSTQLCSEDNECFSGKCYNRKCISNDNTDKNSIILCSGQEKEYYMLCGKDSGMKCEDKEECYSKMSIYNFCSAPPLYAISNTTAIIIRIIIITLIIVVVIALCVYAQKRKRKRKKKDEQKEEQKDEEQEIIENEKKEQEMKERELKEITTI